MQRRRLLAPVSGRRHSAVNQDADAGRTLMFATAALVATVIATATSEGILRLGVGYCQGGWRNVHHKGSAILGRRTQARVPRRMRTWRTATSTHTAPYDKEAVQQLLQTVWGYSSLLPHQEDFLRGALSGKDVLLVSPTGSGKSLCFQIPALLRDGLTIIVSPLIALMKDQVDALCAKGVAAAHLASTVPKQERSRIESQIAEGVLKLLYVSPKWAAAPANTHWLGTLNLEAFVVDEAHCICIWGPNFIKEYAALGKIRRLISDASGKQLQTMAVTATATLEMRKQISETLGMEDPVILSRDSDRPNLVYRARRCDRKKDARDQVLQTVQKHANETGIIYCITIKDVDKMTKLLQSKGVPCERYHGGLTRKERDKVSNMFSSGWIGVIVATIAFGMGVDRADVRYVIHFALPKSLLYYAQETGRAGRDGLKAECFLFWTRHDPMRWKRVFSCKRRGKPERWELDQLGESVAFASSSGCRHQRLAEKFGTSVQTPCGACDFCLDEKFIPEDDSATSSSSGEVATKVKKKVSTKVAKKKAAKSLPLATDFPDRLAHVIVHASATRSKKRETFLSTLEPEDRDLYGKLKALRLQLAKAEDTKAFMIFHDKTLVELTKHKPRNDQELLCTYGIGPHKLYRYGAEILKVIETFSKTCT